MLLRNFRQKLVVITLLVLNIICLYKIRSKSILLTNAQRKLEDCTRGLSVVSNQLSRFTRALDVEGELITDSILNVVEDQKLIVRFNSDNCDVCKEILFHYLEKNVNSIGKENILFYVLVKNENEFRYYQNKLARIGQVIRLKKGDVVNDLESMNLPYLFVKDVFNRYSFVFIPEKNNQVIYEKYLTAIPRLLFYQ